MKKMKLNLIAALLTCLSLPMAAQNTAEDEFEIIFTDDGNQREVIGVPMALYMSELDSLMSLYHNQNYLTIDDDCVIM